jgi:hypothetical protein
LRGGVYLIPYLEPGHYLGIDKEQELIDAGIKHELGIKLYNLKKPRLLVSDSFQFEKFDIKPDYALAQALFTQLPPLLIERCLKKLRQSVATNCVFYATFFESQTVVSNPLQPHDHIRFFYTRWQIEQFGLTTGWKTEYIGDWNHPRKQVIVRYRPL